MKRRVIAALLTGVMCVGMAGCGGQENASPDSSEEQAGDETSGGEYVIKLCTEQTDGDPIDDGCDKWAELVSEATDGAVTIEVYPSSQLGDKADLIEMAMMGQNV